MTEEELRQKLDQIEQEHAEIIAAAEAAVETEEAAQATAGSEYDEQVAAAEAAVVAGETAYQETISTWDQKLADTQAAIDSIQNPGSAQDEINAIGNVSNVTLNGQTIADVSISTGGTPDCSAADITAAINLAIDRTEAALNSAITETQTDVNAMIADLNDEIAKIKASVQALQDVISSLSLPDIRNALQAAKDTAQTARSLELPLIDTEAEKATNLSVVDVAFQI